MVETQEKKAALICAFGCVEDLNDLKPYLSNILKGRELPDAVLEKIRKRYEAIGGKSPLLDLTRDQARAIEEKLAEKGHPIKVYVGMRYWHPYIKETMEKMLDEGIERVTTVIMTPFDSPVATGGYELAIEEVRDAHDGEPRVDILGNWHMNPTFHEAVIENIESALGEFDDPKDALVIYSSHSLPRDALEGDAYEMKVNQCVGELNRRFPTDHVIAYQSQGSTNVDWLGPSTEESIEKAAKEGKKGVVVVPVGFVSDHVETLYDIDISHKEIAEKNGLKFARSASLNNSPKFIEMLSHIIWEQSTRF